ncbi:MAG: hypothetical protein KDA88_00540 [Planctomycetaceae bacterium]|nr:hypothetical protein [Planctomycetaceae bacterium]MCB9951498.1 hypothetical protein [Planctomycetaceae bacterium]
MSLRIHFAVGLLLTTLTATTQAESFLKNGDRVVLLGGTLIEREQVEGYWETQITLATPHNVTFRNLGWSGDTVWCESRGMFDPPAAGYARMLNQVGEINPTVIILGYGGSEAFHGPLGVESFKIQCKKMIAELRTPERRFVLLTPQPMAVSQIPGRDRGPAEEMAARYNEYREAYVTALREIAAEEQALLIDLAEPVQKWTGRPLTDNGITLNALGYWVTGQAVTSALTGSSAADKVKEPELLSVSPLGENSQASSTEQIRTLIRHKNELVFHRWRPQNFTYLFGFRKHEQGNNSVEIPQFDPLVEELELQIAALKK